MNKPVTKPMTETLNKSLNKTGYRFLIGAAIIGLAFTAPHIAVAEDITAQAGPTDDPATDMEIAHDITAPAPEFNNVISGILETPESSSAIDAGAASTQNAPDATNDAANIDDQITEEAVENDNIDAAEDDNAPTRSEEVEDLAQEAENAANDSVMQPTADNNETEAGTKTSENKRWWGRPY